MESMNDVEKTLIHISHLHPLKLAASPKPRPICHACNMPCADQSYGCVPCYYFLHNTCATTGRTMNHPSHPLHTLNLELTPAYNNGQYGCDACGISGGSFCLRCRECSYDLHLHCAAVPHELDHSSHHHSLTLVYKNPYSSDVEFSCDQCEKHVDINKWFYLCKSCDFGGHVGCFSNSSDERLEVLSPGLQQSQSQSQSQKQTAAQLQRQMMHANIENRMYDECMKNALIYRRGSALLVLQALMTKTLAPSFHYIVRYEVLGYDICITYYILLHLFRSVMILLFWHCMFGFRRRWLIE